MENSITALRQLLTEEEIKELTRSSFIRIQSDLDILKKEVKKLTWEELSSISLMLIGYNYNLGDNGKCPECNLPAKAIEILTERAIEKKLPIF